MKNISIGYFNLQNDTFISGREINGNFLGLLSRYAHVEFIPVQKETAFKSVFLRFEKRKFDYLYVNSFCFLEETFLVREKFGLNIPLILNLHTAFRWANDYAFIIPLIRKYDVLIAPCEYTKKSFQKISNKFKIHVIPRFYDTRFIQNNITMEPDDTKRIITFLGRLTKKKGAELLINCMRDIVKKVRNVHLNIIGPLSKHKATDYPKDSYVRKLEKKVRDTRLTQRIHFLGLKTGLEKYRLLSHSNVFVNPTTAKEESLSSTNIEALICGVPVITTNWAGNSELVKDGYNGFLINVKSDSKDEPVVDLTQLTAKIVTLLKNKKLNNTLKRNAIKTGKEYDYHRLLPRFIKLLRKRNAHRARKKRWDFLQNKKPSELQNSFSKDFLFFLNFYYRARNKSYASLYQELIEGKAASKNKTIPTQYSMADKKLLKKIRNDFFNFLKKDR